MSSPTDRSSTGTSASSPTPQDTQPPRAPSNSPSPQAGSPPQPVTRTAAARPYALGAFRVVTGGLFACHGAAALFGVLGGAAGGHGGTVPTLAWPEWYAAVIQLCCGTLVLLGLGTRQAAFLAAGSMAYAYFTVHQPEALWPLQNGGEPAALFCWSFLLLMFTGPGRPVAGHLLPRASRAGRAAHPTH